MLADSYKNAKILSTFVENGKEYAKIEMRCDRCGGSGIFYVGIMNGQGVPASPYGGICYKCDGTGVVTDTVRNYTPEQIAALDRQKEAKRRKQEAGAQARIDKINLTILARYGFEDVRAYFITGDTFELRDRLKELGAKFSYELLWVMPTQPPEDLTYVAVGVEQVFQMNDSGIFQLKDDAKQLRRELEGLKGAYLGAIGDKITATCQVLKVFANNQNRYWEPSFTYILVDEGGNTLVWKTTSHLENDKSYRISGKIKDLTEFRNIRQTVITRCTFEEVHHD